MYLLSCVSVPKYTQNGMIVFVVAILVKFTILKGQKISLEKKRFLAPKTMLLVENKRRQVTHIW